MPYQITNVLDSRKGPAKAAYKKDPVVRKASAVGRIAIGTWRIKTGGKITIGDAAYKANKDLIDKYAAHGVIELLAIGGAPAKVETPSPKKASSPTPPASLPTKEDSTDKKASTPEASPVSAKESGKGAVISKTASKAEAPKKEPAKKKASKKDKKSKPGDSN